MTKAGCEDANVSTQKDFCIVTEWISNWLDAVVNATQRTKQSPIIHRFSFLWWDERLMRRRGQPSNIVSTKSKMNIQQNIQDAREYNTDMIKTTNLPSSCGGSSFSWPSSWICGPCGSSWPRVSILNKNDICFWKMQYPRSQQWYWFWKMDMGNYLGRLAGRSACASLGS